MSHLKEVMRSRGYGCTTLARKLTSLGYKIGRMGVWHWVVGHSTPSGDGIYLLAAVLKVHPARIVQLEFDEEKQALYQRKYCGVFNE